MHVRRQEGRGEGMQEGRGEGMHVVALGAWKKRLCVSQGPLPSASLVPLRRDTGELRSRVTRTEGERTREDARGRGKRGRVGRQSEGGGRHPSCRVR